MNIFRALLGQDEKETNNWEKTGDELRDAIERAIRTGDCSEFMESCTAKAAETGTRIPAESYAEQSLVEAVEDEHRDETDEAAVWRGISGIPDAGKQLWKDDPGLAQMITQGQEFTGRLRDLNRQIPGETVSEKLDALTSILKEIFTRVRDYPKYAPKMQKLMNYYLPTTLKLMEAYREFDGVRFPNQEVLSAKEKLEKTLDTMTASMTELLHQMYQPSVLDAVTDAEVLQGMLMRDGLLQDHPFDRE